MSSPPLTQKILVVDDDALLREGTARLMRKAGYEVRVAADGAQALAELETEAPDMVLLDVNLPDMSGLEICRRIRSEAGYKGVYVVMLSSQHTSTDEQVDGLAVGADGYIERPLPNRELMARVEALLRLKSEEEALRRAEIWRMKARHSESVGTMAGGIAHDYNNLLSIIIGNIDLAQDLLPSTSLANEHLGDAMAACQWARSLTHKFLTLSRSSVPRITSVDVPSLVTGTIDDPKLKGDVHIHLEMAQDLPQIEADPYLLQQAISCLVENAMEAMPHGGTLEIHGERVSKNEVEADISLALSDQGYVAISVKDDGVGISAGTLPRVFDPYFSTKARGAQRGMGLGLATAKAIIDLQGGALRIESEVDRGTLATIMLPVSRASENIATSTF